MDTTDGEVGAGLMKRLTGREVKNSTQRGTS